MIDNLIQIANFFPYCMTIVDMEKKERLCLFANDKFTKNTGYTAKEAIGRNLSFLQGKNTSNETVEFMRNSFKNKHACVQDILNYKKDGTPFLNRLLMLPLQSDGEIFYVGFQNDITQLRGLDYDSNHLKKVMDGEIKHMINNPLAIVLGTLTMALKKSKSQEEIKLAVANLSNTFERINHFSINLEDISQFENFKY